MNKSVLISGGTGLVGSRLSELLQEKGYEVAYLSRSTKAGKFESIQWDVQNMQLDSSKIERFSHIINLAGAGIIDKPWTEKRKQFLLESRTQSILLLKQAIEQNTKRPDSFISASAIGYYGIKTTKHTFSEEDEAGNDFLADTCVKWEAEVDKIAQLGISTAKIRIGLVLANEGGALKSMAKPIYYGFGSALGTGKQILPWIHIDDLCRIFIYALENKLEGAFNAVAPNSVDNSAFTKTLGKVLLKPLWLPRVPAFVLKLILGRRAELVLEGSRVSCKKIQERGFEFNYKNLEKTLEEIYTSNI